MSEKLSKDFTLGEWLRSGTATKYEYTEQWSPNNVVLDNIKHSNDWLQKLRDKFGSAIYITSGYRCSRLNEKVGGATKSWHTTGEAVDIRALNGQNKKLWDSIIELGGFYMAIWYYEGDQIPRWIHITIRDEENKNENKKELLRYSAKGGGYPEWYEPVG